MTATFTDGSTETINARDGVSLAVGARFDLTDNLEIAMTYGVKVAAIVLEGDGVAAGKIDFDDALGTLIDMRYFFGESAYVGGRATFIDY